MKNPLRKRLPRELCHDLGKYIALFLFLVATIGFVSGFLVADNSMSAAYNDSFTKYNVEDGHFALSDKADDALLSKVEAQNVTIYPLFYKDMPIDSTHTVRVFRNRNEVNKVCLMNGSMPVKANEIVLDRLYASNNSISIGDTITFGHTDYVVSGTIAMSDYSSMFKNNTDMMFNANCFSIAVVTDAAYDAIEDSTQHYCYAWRNTDRDLSETAKADQAEEIKTVLMQTGLLTDFVKQADNQAITFTGDDMGSDKSMITCLLYVVIVVLAFVFAVTTKNTIEQESSVIGTLRASGYTKHELLLHYLTLPTLITLAAALVGNVLGYTCMNHAVSNLYYASYCLPTYTMLWNANAFLMTTIIPCLIILAVNYLTLLRTLSLSPLRFLRHDLKRNQKKKATKLPNWRFLTRFRIRIIQQNIPTYLTLFSGIFLASLLLLFGMIMNPLLSHYKTEVLDSKIANYQYILKAPVATKDTTAEAYALTSLHRPNSGEEITVYGITKNSTYLKDLPLPTAKGEVTITKGYSEKYHLAKGDHITLEDPNTGKSYSFTVGATFPYAASLSVFLTQESYNHTFGNADGYYNGYFANHKLTDLNKLNIATTITSNDLTVLADQLNDSLGGIFPLVSGFAAILYILLMYLLAKVVVEKNAGAISMIKILGYTDKEAGKLYNTATTIVVGLSLLITLPLDCLVMKGLYYIFMQKINGWVTFYIAPWLYPAMLLIGAVCYLIVHAIQTKRIRKIPMSQALKDME